jgi:hypothetical protein
MSNCTTCGNCQDDCNCVPKGMTTPNYCPADLPTCPTPSPCNETFDSKCVVYTGEDISCFGIEKGDSVEEIIINLTNHLTPIFCLQCVALTVPSNDATGLPYDQTMTWNIVPGATSYNVYFGTSSTNPPLVSTGQISTSYTYPYPLLPGTDYYWKVVPVNNAGTAQNCPIYHFTTKVLTCVNPLSYMLDYVLSEQGSQSVFNPATLVTSINDFLDNGELITNCNFCCPDCTETKRYVLASAPLYALYYSQFYSLPNCEPVCCSEVDASLTAMTTEFAPLVPSLSAAFKLVPPVTNCCGTNFSECAESLKLSLGTQRDAIFKVLGIVEESTISSSTELCILATFLNSLPGITTDLEKANIIAAILNKGFIVQCRPEGTIISGFEAYKAYIVATQDGCLCYKPCVI